jgi:hypothetical protein
MKLQSKTMLVETKRQRLYADYHQLSIRNYTPLWPTPSARFPGAVPEPELWTQQAFFDRLGAIPGQLGVITASYSFVEVVAEIYNSEPTLDVESWDHIAEGPLEMKTPDLIITGLLGDDNPILLTVPPGTYRVRCSYANQAGGTDGGGEAQDWYRIQMWPAPLSPVQVHKRAEQPGAAREMEVAPRPSVSLQPSAGGETRVSLGPEGLTAQAISPRRLLSLAFRGIEGEAFPEDRIAAPPGLDQGRYDVSATGQGWPYALKHLLCDYFHLDIQLGMSTAGPGYYLFVEDIGAKRKREEQIRDHLIQQQRKQ